MSENFKAFIALQDIKLQTQQVDLIAQDLKSIDVS